MIKKFLQIAFFLAVLTCSNLKSQEVVLVTENQPVNQVLNELRQKFDIQLSYNNNLLSGYNITISKSFNSIDEALQYIVKDIPIAVEKFNNVYVFTYKANLAVPRDYMVLGQVKDKLSGEGLPYAQVMINRDGMITDFDGNYSYTSKTDSVFQLRISYLGYYFVDTVVLPGENQDIELIPSKIGLEEIVVEKAAIDYTTQLGQQPGEIKLNHKVSVYLPGYGSNSVFNLLRLQPGILASGEHSNDLIIWGCYEGQSKVLFDGFTIYKLKNYNDNISAVNPLIVKDIKIHKAGYAANYGERVGGIVDITGLSGNAYRPAVQLSINNNTINGMASAPYGKHKALIAFRQTYYNLYKAEDLNLRKALEDDRTNVYPDYSFRDLNLKFSGAFNNNDYYQISFYNSADKFGFDLLQVRQLTDIEYNAHEQNTQYGGATQYGKIWNNGQNTSLTLNHSNLLNNKHDIRQLINRRNQRVISLSDEKFINSINESSAQLDHTISFTNFGHFTFGAGYKNNTINFEIDSAGIIYSNNARKASRFFTYYNQHFNLSQNLSLTPGLRVDYVPLFNKSFWQPRFSAQLKANKSLSFKFATGVYNQFVVRSTEVDEYYNYRYIWTLSDNHNIPVLNSKHFVLGSYYAKNNWMFTLESFYKVTNGITRVKNLKNIVTRTNNIGQAQTYGFDIYIKKEFGLSSAWVSYTLSKTEERFGKNEMYHLAPQDQTHELKLASLVHVKPFFISANYVYGSGFPDLSTAMNDVPSRLKPYNRLDASVVYKFNTRRIKLETGISVLNVLDYENIKRENFIKLPANQATFVNIYAESVPFTPTLFLNIRY